MRGTATLKYDFDSAMWAAVLDSNPNVCGYGETPDEAVRALEKQANKHDLWPINKGEARR